MHETNLSGGREKVMSKLVSPRRKPPARMLTRSQVAAAVQRMAAPKGTERFAAGKAVAATADRAPDRVYPHFTTIAALLDGDCKIVRWNAVQTLGALAGVDAPRQIDGVLDKLLSFIRCGQLVSAANAIGALGRIMRHRPDLVDAILPSLLRVQQETFETPECRNVIAGQALNVLEDLWDDLRARPGVMEFVRQQQRNPRPAVARRAAALAASRSGCG
ncbi:hypothetical protein RAS1_40640 [Phycisphaerae bacterium RAS1]|nr:hypothetical protein RAS1_40640 [Phycisphaerae bacterium RAS1]